jgi:predicted enzyme involved in methoxymalonyl-ACP biosynthesis
VAGFGADEELIHEHEADLARVQQNVDVYAHVEGLVGEERELLEQAEEEHHEEHRERLHAIRQELDRAWEALHRRAERRAKPGN